MIISAKSSALQLFYCKNVLDTSPNSSAVFKKIIVWFCTDDKTETMIGFEGMPWLLKLPC